MRFLTIRILALLHLAIATVVGGQADPFIRYATPGECVASYKRVEKQFWRDKRLDTVYAGSLGLPGQPHSVEQARICVSRFTVDGVPERDLLALGNAYLVANLDSLAEKAFQRLVNAKAKGLAREHAWALVQIVNIYTGVAPVRLEQARRYAADLSKLGPSVATERMLADLDIIDAVQRTDSAPLMREAVDAAMKAIDDIVVDSVRKQRYSDIISVYAALSHFYMRRNEFKLANGILEKANAKFDGIFSTNFLQYRLLGKPAPKLRATQWFNNGSGDLSSLPGKLTLVTFGSHDCGDACYAGYAVTRRLQKQYPISLVNFVFLVRTEGFYGNSIFEPAAEIELTQEYFLKRLGLPVSLGIWQTDFGRKRDGRLDVLTNPNESAYHPLSKPPLQTYVIDKNGDIRFITHMLQRYEIELNNMIKELLVE